VPRKPGAIQLIHSSLNDGRLSSLVKIQPVHLVSFKPVRTGTSPQAMIATLSVPKPPLELLKWFRSAFEYLVCVLRFIKPLIPQAEV